MRLSAFTALLAASSFALPYANAQAATPKPPAPQVTVGADLKHLLFDWEPVPRATYYQLYENATGASGFTPVGPQIPASQTSAKHPIAVHLQRWQDARYLVAACNAAGCRHSASIFPRDQMLDTIGYFKASNTGAGDAFGREVQLSLDGNTLVVGAPAEASNATGVNGSQSNNSFENSGAAYVFRRISGKWRQEAYLKPGTNQPNARFGAGYPFDFDGIAVSATGSRVAVAATGESFGGLSSAGAVYIYRRASNGTWSIEARVQAPQPIVEEFFGSSVDLSDDGSLLKVSSTKPRDGEGNVHGRAYFYVRSGSTWQYQSTVDPVYAGDFCPAVRMSGDASTLIQHCYNYSSVPTDPSSRIVTLKRQGSSWVHVADINDSGASTQWPALSHDGNAVALRISPLNRFVRIWRWTNGAWVEEVTLSTPVPNPNPSGDSDAFGYRMAFNRTGSLLAIGAQGSPATGAGVSQMPTTWGEEVHGAVFLYQRRSNGSWSVRSQIKAPHPGLRDSFGAHMALCGTGRTLAVGAPGEDSKARGIDGHQLDNSAESAGAAYLY